MNKVIILLVFIALVTVTLANVVLERPKRQWAMGGGGGGGGGLYGGYGSGYGFGAAGFGR